MVHTLALSTEDMLARLVAFDTTSRQSNLALVAWIRDWLAGFGVPCRLSHEPGGTKANLHAVLGPPGPGGLALSGHLDTVPVDGQAWTGDPFQLRRQGDRLVARGAADMKGFVAVCLEAVPDLLAARLPAPVHLLFTYDEEVGCHGAARLIEDIAESGWRPAQCLVGEPTALRPVPAHKGTMVVGITVRGTPGHSSRPDGGANAIHAAADLVGWISAAARDFATDGPFDGRFTPPHATVQVGQIKGGSAVNIIPEHASLTMELRCLPGQEPRAFLAALRQWAARHVEPELRRIDPSCGLEFDVRYVIPPLSVAQNRFLDLLGELTGQSPAAESYATEAGLFAAAGIPTIVCGPGDIAQAHKADEWVEAGQLAACGGLVRRLAERCAA